MASALPAALASAANDEVFAVPLRLGDNKVYRAHVAHEKRAEEKPVAVFPVAYVVVFERARFEVFVELRGLAVGKPVCVEVEREKSALRPRHDPIEARTSHAPAVGCDDCRARPLFGVFGVRQVAAELAVESVRLNVENLYSADPTSRKLPWRLRELPQGFSFASPSMRRKLVGRGGGSA